MKKSIAIREIYENADGSMPDMSDLKQNVVVFRVYRFTVPARFWRRWLDRIFIFQPSSGFKRRMLFYQSPEKRLLWSGDYYRVRYRNNQGASLSVVLQVRYRKVLFLLTQRARPMKKR